jgi:hypothetical protein
MGSLETTSQVKYEHQKRKKKNEESQMLKKKLRK